MDEGEDQVKRRWGALSGTRSRALFMLGKNSTSTVPTGIRLGWWAITAQVFTSSEIPEIRR
jgi:hypothetical protein